jgi:hypothetical protein
VKKRVERSESVKKRVERSESVKERVEYRVLLITYLPQRLRDTWWLSSALCHRTEQ